MKGCLSHSVCLFHFYGVYHGESWGTVGSVHSHRTCRAFMFMWCRFKSILSFTDTIPPPLSCILYFY